MVVPLLRFGMVDFNETDMDSNVLEMVDEVAVTEAGTETEEETDEARLSFSVLVKSENNDEW